MGVASDRSRRLRNGKVTYRAADADAAEKTTLQLKVTNASQFLVPQYLLRRVVAGNTTDRTAAFRTRAAE